MPKNEIVTRKQDSIDLPPEVQREAFDGMLTILRGMGTTMTQRGEPRNPEIAYAMAILACKLDLEPTMGHVLMLGSKPYVTVAGLLHNANKRPDYDGYEARPATKEEREQYYSPSEDPGDEHLWRCAVHVKNRKLPTVAYGRCKVATHGIDERAGGGNRFTPAQQWSVEMAENRAIGRALRRCFSIGAPVYEEMVREVVDITPEPVEVKDEPTTAPKRRKRRKKPAPVAETVVEAELEEQPSPDDALEKVIEAAAAAEALAEAEEEASEKKDVVAATVEEIPWG